MSKEVVFIKPSASPHYPMESIKVHACWVAHVGVKKAGIFIALSPAIKHTLTHTNLHTQADTQYSNSNGPHSERFQQLLLCSRKIFLSIFEGFSRTDLAIPLCQ